MDELDVDPLNRPMVYAEGENVFYRASSLGGCLRALALARQGYEPLGVPEKILKVFEAGHEAERQAWAKGILTGLAQEFVSLQVSETIFVVGHLDAWSRGVITELKSSTEAEFKKPWRETHMGEKWAWQISCYMNAAPTSQLRFVRVLRDADGNILGQTEETLEVPPYSTADIRLRVLEVERLALLDLDKLDCVREFPCPFYYTHSDPGQIREYCDDESAVSLAKEYEAVRAEARSLRGRQATARSALLTWMGDRDKVELPGGWKMTRYTIKGGKREFVVKDSTGLRVTPPSEESEADDAGEVSV
jgi:hypothetical protein